MANHLDLEEQEQLDQLRHFWNTWGTPISVALVVVAGSLAAWNGYQYWQTRQASQAAALFDVVDVAARSGDQARVAQAFGDLKSKYAGTVQAAQAGLQAAKTAMEAGNPDAAKEALAWVADKAGDEGLKALARLRLASVLLDQKAHDEALKQLAGNVPAEFEAVFADRRGDVLVAQDKRTEAIAEYTKAYKGLEEGVEYRRLVEIKLGALGAAPQGAAPQGVAVAAAGAASAQEAK